jgi:hypothetical protein
LIEREVAMTKSAAGPTKRTLEVVFRAARKR